MITFKEFLSEQEIFTIEKNLSGQQLKDAISKIAKKCKQDHRGVKYDKSTGKLIFT